MGTHPKSRTKRAGKSQETVDCSVYDGRSRLGKVRGSAASGYDAHDLAGKFLGRFTTIKAAASQVGKVATGGVS